MARAKKKSTINKKNSSTSSVKREYLSQSDVPAYTLEESLRVARSLADEHGCKPTRPLLVAQAMRVSPTSGGFRGMCGASIAYGLTVGGYNASEIALTELGRRIVRPTSEGDDDRARREAIMRPKAIGQFLERYDGAKLPRPEIGRNVLSSELGVPESAAERAMKIIAESAAAVGVLTDIRGEKYVNLSGITPSTTDVSPEQQDPAEPEPESEHVDINGPPVRPKLILDSTDDKRLRRVFVTHGKNRDLVDPIKRLLAFGELEAVVAAETFTVSESVPDKWASAMRSCGAAIIHIDDERRLMDSKTKEHVILNPNVLIEIGAAMVLYGKRFIFLVKEGVDLPSNLQGIFEVRYEGETLDGESTVRLLEAIQDMKTRELPSSV